MKVLQVASSLFEWKGIERWLMGLVAAQRGRGTDVQMACPPGSPLLRAGLDAGIACHEISIDSQQDWRCLPRFVRLLRRERPDVLHTHFPPDFIVPAAAARLCRVPAVVMTRHAAWTWRGFKRRLYSGLYDRIIAVSDAAREAILSGGMDPNKVVTVLNGIAVRPPAQDRASVRAALGIPPGEVVVGMCARVITEKGQRVLVRAIAEVPDAVGLIAGDGEDLPRVQALAHELGIADRIRFTGYVEDPESYVDAMDIVAAPSTWPDALPQAVQQAMLMGKPVVASAVGGIPELIRDGQTGILVPKEDAASLAEQLSRLACDPALRNRLAAATKADADGRFCPARMAEGVDAVYMAAMHPGLHLP